jgi:hypothetical protein
MIYLGKYFIPALCDSDLSMPFLRRDVLEKIKQLGITYKVSPVQEASLMADVQTYDVKESISLPVKIQIFPGNLIFCDGRMSLALHFGSLCPFFRSDHS